MPRSCAFFGSPHLSISPAKFEGVTMTTRKRTEFKSKINAPLRHTIRPGISSPIYMRTVPRATCVLYRSDDNDPERRLKLFADDDGIICVHVRPSVEAEHIAKLVVECNADGRLTHYALELRSNHKDSTDMPFPDRERPMRKESLPIRPALPRDEGLRLSKEELFERGYPPRPDPEALVPFKRWLRAVSAPTKIVNPRLTPNPGVTHGPLQSTSLTNSIWSGFLLSGGPFNEVWGTWNVPYAIFGETNVEDYSAFWIGIDGYNLSDLVQAGTEQNILDFNFFGNTISFATYYAWTEFLPQQGTEQVISNLPVNPGDEMLVLIVFTGSTAYFFVQNSTSNEYVLVPTPSGRTVVSATEVEWIMERPSVNNIPTDLAGYGFAGMRDAFASILGGPGVPSYQGVNLGAGTLPALQSLQLTMQNGNNVLSQVFPLDELSMFFFWSGFH
jgi:Peptidase A4 family